MKNKILFSVLVFSFLVSILGCKKDDEPPIQPPPVDTGTFKVSLNDVQINASTYTMEILKGDSVKFSWNYTGKTPFEIQKNHEYFSSRIQGVEYVVISQQTIFTFWVQGVLQQKTVTINPKGAELPKITLTADFYSIEKGNSVLLKWDAEDADSVGITSFPVTILRFSVTDSIGSISVTPTESTTYTATAYSKSGSASSSVDIMVTNPPVPTRFDSIVGSWRDDLELVQWPGSTKWDTAGPEECKRDDTTKFLNTGWYQKTQGSSLCGWLGNFQVYDSGLWSLLENGAKIKIQNNIWSIDKFTGDKLEMTFSTQGQPTSKYFYSRYQQKK